MSALHSEIESVLTGLERTLGTPLGTYDQHVEAYDRIRVDLRTLRVRAEARPRNAIQVAQLGEGMRQLDLLEQAHREGLQPEEIAPFRNGFGQSVRAMLTLELAKKRGESVSGETPA